MTKNQIVLLYGMPAAGKLTMARRLAGEGNSFLLDDHLFLNFVTQFVDNRDYRAWGTERFNDLMADFRFEFIKILSEFYRKDAAARYIFTIVLFSQKRIEFIKALDRLADEMSGDFFPIYLSVRPEVLKTRCAAPEREQRGKLHRPEQYDEVFGGRFEQMEFEHPNRVTIDSSDLSEDETFAAIKNHLGVPAYAGMTDAG